MLIPLLFGELKDSSREIGRYLYHIAIGKPISQLTTSSTTNGSLVQWENPCTYNVECNGLILHKTIYEGYLQSSLNYQNN